MIFAFCRAPCYPLQLPSLGTNAAASSLVTVFWAMIRASRDFFYPSGMTGKKKVSKFFKDEKFSLIDKSSAWILYSDNQIVWIIGIRQDERFKIVENTTNILQIKVL